MHNSFVYDPKHINADKVRQEAVERKEGRGWLSAKPESTIIHYHAVSELCKEREHEFVMIDTEGVPDLSNFSLALGIPSEAPQLSPVKKTELDSQLLERMFIYISTHIDEYPGDEQARKDRQTIRDLQKKAAVQV